MRSPMRSRMVGADYCSEAPVPSDGSASPQSGEKSGNRRQLTSDWTVRQREYCRLFFRHTIIVLISSRSMSFLSSVPELNIIL